jgi:hypothetical protein
MEAMMATMNIPVRIALSLDKEGVLRPLWQLLKVIKTRLGAIDL